jgi:hypothetical protein
MGGLPDEQPGKLVPDGQTTFRESRKLFRKGRYHLNHSLMEKEKCSGMFHRMKRLQTWRVTSTVPSASHSWGNGIEFHDFASSLLE